MKRGRTSMKKRWILGTRGSKLALVQTEIVRKTLERLYPHFYFETKVIRTTGDSVWNTPLYLIGEKGLFVKEIEEALGREEVDMAVHSMKDLPTQLMDGLVIAAIMKREDPRDTFISLKHGCLADVPPGGTIGTSSMRRKAQLLALNREWEIVPLRGNVDTRIRKLEEQDLDGIILAWAGTKRMGFEGSVKEVLPFEVMVPPGGQGAIGIETRQDDEAQALVASLNDDGTFLEVVTERRLQEAIGGGCSVPLGINASLVGGTLVIRMVYGREDGVILFRGTASGPREEAHALTESLLVDWKAAT